MCELILQIVELLDEKHIKFTSIDLVRFSWIIEKDENGEELLNSNYDPASKENYITNPTIWIGVFPSSLMEGEARVAAERIGAILVEYGDVLGGGGIGIDVAFRESVVRFLSDTADPDGYTNTSLLALTLAHSPAPLPLPLPDPTPPPPPAPLYEPGFFNFPLQPTTFQDLSGNLSTALSLQISGRETTMEGMLGFYFRVEKELYAVTARHVLFPLVGDNEEYVYEGVFFILVMWYIDGVDVDVDDRWKSEERSSRHVQSSIQELHFIHTRFYQFI